MKAATIATVLRATRSRMEGSGVTHFGIYEMIALNISAHTLENELFRVTSIVLANSLKQKKVFMLPYDEMFVKYIKQAYKHFDTFPPDKEFEVHPLEECFTKTESLPPEVLAFADNEWLKSQIESIGEINK